MIKYLRTRRNVRNLNRALAPYRVSVSPTQQAAWEDYETQREDYANRYPERTQTMITRTHRARSTGARI